MITSFLQTKTVSTLEQFHSFPFLFTLPHLYPYNPPPPSASAARVGMRTAALETDDDARLHIAATVPPIFLAALMRP